LDVNNCAGVTTTALSQGGKCQVKCQANYTLAQDAVVDYTCDNGLLKPDPSNPAVCQPTCGTITCSDVGMEPIPGMVSTTVCENGNCQGTCCRKSV
jgi:hypothetical protein